MQFAEFARVVFFPENTGNLRHEPGGVREVGRANQVARHRRVLCSHRVDGQPIAVGCARANQILRCSLLVFDPALHRIVVLREDLLVAVVPVDFPRTNHPGIGPRRVAELLRAVFSQHVGSDVGIRAVRPLAVAQVLQPFAEKFAHVVVERRRSNEDLRVAGPAETFVALRAVGRDIEEIPAQAPADVAVEAVEQRIRATELSGRLHVGVQDQRGEKIG